MGILFGLGIGLGLLYLWLVGHWFGAVVAWPPLSFLAYLAIICQWSVNPDDPKHTGALWLSIVVAMAVGAIAAALPYKLRHQGEAPLNKVVLNRR